MSKYVYWIIGIVILGLVNYGVYEYSRLPEKVNIPTTTHTTPVKPTPKPKQTTKVDCTKWSYLVNKVGQDSAQKDADKYGLHAQFAACGGKK